MSSVHDWAAPNPVRTNRSGIIGKAVDRYEGPLKVTGTAPYAYEVTPPSPAAYGVMIGAGIASGRITGADIAAAEASPGVLAVWTHLNVPAQPPRGAKAHPRSTQGSKPALESDRVAYFGQPVAFVVADTLENAVSASHLVALSYAEDAPDATFADRLDAAASRRAKRMWRSAASRPASPPATSGSTKSGPRRSRTTARWSPAPPPPGGRGTGWWSIPPSRW